MARHGQTTHRLYRSIDRPVIVAYLMIIVMMFVVINLVVDVMYSILDPRVRLQDVKA